MAPWLALTVLVSGCSLLADEPAPPGEAAEPVALLEDADRLRAVVADLLAERGAAVRRGDVASVVAQAEPAARPGQRRYARNLAQLPLQVFDYRVGDDPADVEVAVADGEVRARVDLATRLRGPDDTPVVAARELVLRPDGGAAASPGDERLLVVSDEPVATDPSVGGPQPWDTGAVEVVRRAGVLGVVDGAAGAPVAERVTEAAADAAEQVAETVPYRWSEALTLYAPSDTSLLEALGGLEPGVADRLDGVTFGVRGASGGPVAAERVVLHPRMLDAADADLDRLLRHELTHVALAARDEGVPRWLSEGVAEWVSVQPLPVGRRLISAEAVRLARRGVDELPGDDGFNGGPRSGADYGIAWQVCEEIVSVYGEDALWTLLEAMRGRGVTDPDEVLRQVLDTTGATLAATAADRIVAAYG